MLNMFVTFDVSQLLTSSVDRNSQCANMPAVDLVCDKSKYSAFVTAVRFIHAVLVSSNTALSENKKLQSIGARTPPSDAM